MQYLKKKKFKNSILVYFFFYRVTIVYFETGTVVETGIYALTTAFPHPLRLRKRIAHERSRGCIQWGIYSYRVEYLDDLPGLKKRLLKLVLIRC